MQSFNAPSMELQTPDGWQDSSAYIITGPKIAGFRPSVVAAITNGVLDPYLKRHVDIQLDQMQQKLAGFSMIHRSDPLKMPYGETIIVEYQWNSAEAGTILRQYQMYVMSGTTLYTLTATAPVTAWPALQSSLVGIIRSFRPLKWGEPPFMG